MIIYVCNLICLSYSILLCFIYIDDFPIWAWSKPNQNIFKRIIRVSKHIEASICYSKNPIFFFPDKFTSFLALWKQADPIKLMKIKGLINFLCLFCENPPHHPNCLTKCLSEIRISRLGKIFMYVLWKSCFVVLDATVLNSCILIKLGEKDANELRLFLLISVQPNKSMILLH